MSEVTSAGESPDENERQDQLHHDDSMRKLQEERYSEPVFKKRK